MIKKYDEFISEELFDFFKKKPEENTLKWQEE
jgi:hypothetical protein